jgi:Holliday junction resolvasome RuvABC endonuclease subunit
MLHVPADSAGEVAIVGIDPGSLHLGTAVLHLDLPTLNITGAAAGTLHSSRLPAALWTAGRFGERLGRIASLEDALVSFFNEVDPVMIACEAAFINLRRPQAHGVLTEVICGVRRAVMRYDTWKPLYLIDPASVKKAVGARGDAGKDAIRAALFRVPDLHCEDWIVPSSLDEHAVDALAVAFARRKAWLEALCLTG